MDSVDEGSPIVSNAYEMKDIIPKNIEQKRSQVGRHVADEKSPNRF